MNTGKPQIKNKNIEMSQAQEKLVKLDAEIAELSKQIDTTPINSRADFIAIKKLYRQWVVGVHLSYYNRSTLAKGDFYYERKKIFRTVNKKTKFIPQALYEYICFLEKDEGLMLPPNFSFIHLYQFRRLTRHLAKSRLNLKYWSNIHKITPSRKIPKAVVDHKISKATKDVEHYHNKMNNLRANLLSKFHASKVRKLENCKKDIVRSINKKYIIDLRKVVKYYNNNVLAIKVLKEIDLQIKYGEFVVILGPSGSGKTTLLNIISGMDNATLGDTVVAHQNLINLNTSQLTVFRRNNIGYIFQQYGLLPNLTVRENVEIGANLQKDTKKRLDIDELLKTIGIYEHQNKFPSELSGGQQQRVSIARSMVKNPQLIFGDEPTGAIDNAMSKHILELFVEINRKFKTTVIIVTHNPIIAELATKVVHVSDGKIVKVVNNKPKSVNDLNWKS